MLMYSVRHHVSHVLHVLYVPCPSIEQAQVCVSAYEYDLFEQKKTGLCDLCWSGRECVT